MLVSVIIPTYNRKDSLKEAINSVLSQTFQDFEVIVVDDGSNWEHRLQTEDHRLQTFYRKNKGAAAARNFGISKSSGKYIAFLDSDDLWRRDKLEKQIRFFSENPEFKICYTNEKWIRNGSHLNQMGKHKKYHGHIFKKCLPLCIISASSIMLERQVFDELGGFDESFKVCEDYELWLRMALKHPIGFIDENLIIKHGGHADQLSKKYWGMDRFRIRALEKILKESLTKEENGLVLEELKHKYNILISGAWKRRKYLNWLCYYFKSRRTFK